MTKQPLTHTSYSPKARSVAAAVQSGRHAAIQAGQAEARRILTPTGTKATVPAGAVLDAYRGKGGK